MDIEGITLLGSIVVALTGWWSWYRPLFSVTKLTSSAGSRSLLGLTPVASAAAMLLVLRAAASQDVRNDPFYLVFYELLGMAWLSAAAALFPFLGINARDDALQRGNSAATWAVSGAVLGVTLCFSGGNIGDGPGVQVVFAAAGLSTLTLFLLWFALEWLGGLSEKITVERDLSCGVRLGGFLVACGLILGAGVAGDWVEGRLLPDFIRFCWPVLILLAAAILVELQLRPSSLRKPAVSALPAAVYVAIAAGYVFALGVPI